MANLTVAEKTHWRDRIQARIDRRIEAITAGEPGLIERIKQEARGRALASLGLAEFQEELDRIVARRAELDRRDTQIRKEMLARVRGVSADDLDCYSRVHDHPEIRCGDHQAAGAARGGVARRERAGPAGAQAPGGEREPAGRDLAGHFAGPGTPALDQGRRAAGRGADPPRAGGPVDPAGRRGGMMSRPYPGRRRRRPRRRLRYRGNGLPARSDSLPGLRPPGPLRSDPAPRPRAPAVLQRCQRGSGDLVRRARRVAGLGDARAAGRDRRVRRRHRVRGQLPDEEPVLPAVRRFATDETGWPRLRPWSACLSFSPRTRRGLGRRVGDEGLMPSAGASALPCVPTLFPRRQGHFDSCSSSPRAYSRDRDITGCRRHPRRRRPERATHSSLLARMIVESVGTSSSHGGRSLGSHDPCSYTRESNISICDGRITSHRSPSSTVSLQSQFVLQPRHDVT